MDNEPLNDGNICQGAQDVFEQKMYVFKRGGDVHFSVATEGLNSVKLAKYVKLVACRKVHFLDLLCRVNK